jgi:hypothetical protein
VLVAWALICPHVAAGLILPIGTRHAALVGLQQNSVIIGTAAGISRIDRPAASEQRNRLGRTAVVPQRAESGVDVVPDLPPENSARENWSSLVI